MKLLQFLILSIVFLPVLGACGTKEREFPGHSRDQVWKAMVQAAEDPRYSDWIVVDNEVWRDDSASRIEIRRDLRRDLMIAGSPPRREECEWKFSALVTDETPPTVEFSTSSIVIPAHFWLQARHYLDEVERRLSGMPLEKKAQITQYSSTDSSRLPERSTPFPVVPVPASDANSPAEISIPKDTQAVVTQPPVTQQDLPVEPVVEPAPIPVTEPVVESVVEPAPTPVTEPVVEPVVEPAPTPVTEPMVEPVVEPAPTPVTEPVVEPVVEPAPIPEPTEPPPFEPPPDP